MRFKSLLCAAALALSGAAATPALAQNCTVFTDVLATDPFCPNVEWLRNRAITLGCSATAYCPTDPVSRLAMAAFMNRLGTALTPVFVRKREPGPAPKNFSTQQILCASDPIAVTGYPRTALVRGLANLYTPDNSMDIKAFVVLSTDNGATWVAPLTNDGTAYAMLQTGLTPPADVSLYPMTAIDLNVNVTYRFALAVERTAGTGAVANSYCENLIQVLNRNGTSSPFDAPADPGPHGRGD